MNAEIFTDKEYTEDKRIDFIRVCQLEVGQAFLLNGTWRVATKKTGGRLHYRYLHSDGSNIKDNIGAKSQQFVQIIKS